MKVLYIASGDSKYGASKSLMSLILYLKNHYDVEPVLLTKRTNQLNKICDQLGIENYCCWYCDFMSGSPYSFFLFKIAKHIIKFLLYIIGSLTQFRVAKCGINFDQIDLVHTNLNRVAIGAYIAERYNIPHIWHLREFGKEDYNVYFYKRNTISYMNKHADVFIAISDIIRNSWIAKGLDEKKIKTIYNGIEKDDYIPRKIRSDKELRLVITGHIQPNKGQLQLVEAVALLPDSIKKQIKVDIIGEGYPDYMRKIRKVICRYSLDNIRFLGYCDHVSYKLSEYDIGVMCSKAEGFGRVTVEYMYAGLYVIASDTGANPELIKDNTCGMLYEYGNVQKLAKCIEEIFIHKEKYLLKNVSNMPFSIDECATKVYKAYQEIV